MNEAGFRVLLAEDVLRALQRAEAHWDFIHDRE